MRDSIEGKGGVQGALCSFGRLSSNFVIIVITFYNRYSGFCIAQEENNFQCWKFRIRALNKKATKLEVI